MFSIYEVRFEGGRNGGEGMDKSKFLAFVAFL